MKEKLREREKKKKLWEAMKEKMQKEKKNDKKKYKRRKPKETIKKETKKIHFWVKFLKFWKERPSSVKVS